MKNPARDREEPQAAPSILTVYRPIEEFCESPALAGGDPEALLTPLDALLVHRLIAMMPGLPVLVDAAAAETGGASSLLGLTHPASPFVLAVAEPASAAERALASVSDHMASREAGPGRIEITSRGALREVLNGREPSLIVVHRESHEGDGLAAGIAGWLEEYPDTLVAVLELGPVGSCQVLQALVGSCGPGSPRALHLVRELGEALAASRLALVARRAHPGLAEVAHRIEELYKGNYGILDLFRQVNHAALRDAGVDAGVLRSHPLSWAVTAEHEALKRAAEEAGQRAAAAAESLADSRRELEQVRQALREAKELPLGIVLAAAPRSLRTWIRRKLAPTLAGRAWRTARRQFRRTPHAGSEPRAVA